MNSVAASQIVLNFFLSAGLMHFFDMLNALQVMCFMTMINQRFPANAQLFVNTIIGILNVDILNPDFLNDMLFNFDRDQQLMEILKDEKNTTYADLNILIPSLTEMGFETYNVILNLQGLFMVFILLIVEYVVLALLLPILYCLEVRRRREKRMYEGGKRSRSCIKRWLWRVGPRIKRFKQSLLFNQPVLVVQEAVL